MIDQTNQAATFLGSINATSYKNAQVFPQFDLSTAGQDRSRAQILSYISLAASVGAILVCSIGRE
jgi:hypothetical protein